jgi:hypothetical protein
VEPILADSNSITLTEEKKIPVQIIREGIFYRPTNPAIYSHRATTPDLPRKRAKHVNLAPNMPIEDELRLYSLFTMKSLIPFLTYSFSITAHAFSSTGKLTAPDGAALDRFGTAVAANGQFILIGSPRDDDHGSSSGSVYVFNASTREFIRKLTAPDGARGDEFGAALSIHGSRALSGARFDDDEGSNSGSAYLFDLNTGSLVKKLTGANVGDQFGKAVAINSTRLAITAWLADPNGESSGQVHLFDSEGVPLKILLPNSGRKFDQFGASAHFDETHLIIGSPFEDSSAADSGAAYLFDNNGRLIQKFTGDNNSGDVFGTSVAVSNGKALIGASFADTTIADSGAAFYFDIAAGELIRRMTASDPKKYDHFGISVSLNKGHLLVGSDFADGIKNEVGRVDLFDAADGTLLNSIFSPDAAAADFFGGSVTLLPGKILASSVQDDDSGSSSGSAYLIELSKPVEGLVLRPAKGGLQLSWTSDPGNKSYQIYMSKDLKNWTLIDDTLTTSTWMIPRQTETPRAFFKVEVSL